MKTCYKCNSTDRVEEHHLWCKYMDNPHGYSFEKNISRVDLCWDCHHTKLHYKIIVPILNKYSRLLKRSDSEYYLWKNIAFEDKQTVIREVVYITLMFINEEKKEDDSNTTARP